MTRDVLVVGAGLAGLAAASALAPLCSVSLLESRPRVGGRASSFLDQHTNSLLDTCQHVSMGCCTNLQHFFHSLHVDSLLRPQRALSFMTPDRRLSSFAADPLPAPFHLARAFWRLHTLSLAEKMRLAMALFRLRCLPPDIDGSFLDWLQSQHQSPRAVERFWNLVLVSALNDHAENVSLRYARKVFVDGFLRHRHGWVVSVPSVLLADLYGPPLLDWFARHHVDLRLSCAVRSLVVAEGRVTQVVLRSGEVLTPSWVVVAVPFRRLLEFLPPTTLELSYFSSLKNLQSAPITSVHLWFDRPVLSLPHVVLVDSVGQWLFNRGQTPNGDFYLQIVVSASRAFRGLPQAEIQARLLAELQERFPTVATAQLLHARVITEHEATFCPVPGVDQWRPQQQSPLNNLFLAGDWTATGWPATMEGAVRSGYLAAEAVCAALGEARRFLQPDLS